MDEGVILVFMFGLVEIMKFYEVCGVNFMINVVMFGGKYLIVLYSMLSMVE